MSDSLSEDFVTKVAEISFDKKQLIDLMNDLDMEKRSIRSFMRQWSNEEKGQGRLVGKSRYTKLGGLCPFLRKVPDSSISTIWRHIRR